jgi:hypothetical protein
MSPLATPHSEDQLVILDDTLVADVTVKLLWRVRTDQLFQFLLPPRAIAALGLYPFLLVQQRHGVEVL